ncbi:MAG: endonuclease [Candidatus Cloacimonadaceae bacterium]|jgi:endonuclease I|nr:endonuclease [Candidatus Cloacimonadota bacterium]MDX9949717.1 endonuclease [Candidatus Syntrophosphaera sp.]
MKKYMIFLTLILAWGIIFAQTTVFNDDFSNYQSANWTTSGQIGSSGWYVTRSGADWGARRNTSPAQLELTNDASGSTNADGWVFANYLTSNFSAPYNRILANNSGQITWVFNIRQIRPNPAGFDSGNYGVAFILGATDESVKTSGSGYAVVYGQSGETDPVRLAKFTGGISNGSLVNLITSNTSGLTDFGAEYLSVKVTYDSNTNKWELFLRNDGGSAFADPLSGNLVSQGTATDNTYTSSSLNYFGAFWQGSFAANQTSFFDNISVQITPHHVAHLNVSPLNLSGFYYILNNGPSQEQQFTVSGSELIQNVTVTASSNYEISLQGGAAFSPTNTINLSPSGGTLSPTTIYVRLKAGLPAQNYINEEISVSTLGAQTETVVCSGAVLEPGITVAPASLSGFSYMFGLGPSSEKSFNVSAQNLYANLIISAPNEFEISLSPQSDYSGSLSLQPNGSSLPPTTVYVRLKAGLPTGNYNNKNIDLNSSGASIQTVSCSGTVISGSNPDVPLALEASAINPGGFTANWLRVENASSYRLDVYTGSDVEDLFISEYVEGSSNNKYIEIYNGTSAAIDLSNYRLQLFANGASSPTNNVQLSGDLASGACVVYKNSAATLQLPSGVTAINNAAVNFNGNDAVALYKISTASYVDIFGRIGENPGNYWGSGSNVTMDKTLVRKAFVTSGITQNPSSGFPTLESEWDFYPKDTVDYLGSHNHRARAISYVPGYENLNVGNVSSHLVSGLEENTLYHYLVRAENPYGTSANSNAIDVTTTSTSDPAIYVSGGFSHFSTPTGTPSQPQSYSLSSANLTQNITISIPSGFEISTNNGNSYSVISTSVSPTFSGQVLVRLSGSASGTYSGNLVHSSPGAPSVSLPLSGLVASENIEAPTLQAHDIIGYPAYTSISLEWTPGNGARRVVKINTNNSFTTPADGSDPTANTFYTGSGEQVIFNGATQFFEDIPFNGCTVTNLTPNTLYWFRIYEYNGSGIDTRYLDVTATNNPQSVSTTASSGSGYYDDIYGYGETLKGMLHELLRTTHSNQYSYNAITNILKHTDEDPANSNNLIEIYTGWSVNKESFGSGTTDWNREHTWSKSHGGFGDVAPAGTDLHHLRPCDSTVNSTKSNKYFNNGGSVVVDASPPAGYSGNTGCHQTSYTWEPRDEDKGDVARMLMYMAVRYEGTDTSYDLELVDHIYNEHASGLPLYGKLATLLQWHVEDPPDAWEIRRNNRIAESQGNRNPFIDIPGYAARIWAPCPLYNSNVSATGFTANWSQPITATSYYLQVATDSLFTDIVSGFSNLPVGLQINKTISGLSEGATYYYRLRSYFESDYGMWSPYLEVVLLSPETASATIIPSQTLREDRLDGASLTLILDNASFADAILLPQNITLNNAPTGLSIHAVNYLDATTATIILAYSGPGFDSNYENFNLTLAALELNVSYSVTSNSLTIHALVESSAIISLENGNIRLDIAPVIGAEGYIIYGSPDPYGIYTDISDSGAFGSDPDAHSWFIPREFIGENRYFFKVAAFM